jgi:hypothetical protein
MLPAANKSGPAQGFNANKQKAYGDTVAYGKATFTSLRREHHHHHHNHGFSWFQIYFEFLKIFKNN